ncbi:MAG: hypothetical protein NC548_30445 [Lachnospiraceae bacterium]|nr:hypothetical protein [Lachnospiraceae bacterium]
MIGKVHKKHMVFSSRKKAESMAAYLEKKGCSIDCLDFDEDWFVVYSEPKESEVE